MSSWSLLPDEVEIFTQPTASITCTNKQIHETLVKASHVTLTNYRLLHLNNSGHLIYSIQLASVSNHETNLNYFGASKLKIECNEGINFTISIGNISTMQLFTSHLRHYLEKKSWLHQVTSKPAAIVNSSTPLYAGVGGLIRRQERELAAISCVQNNSLADLQSLMKHAHEVVKIVEQYCMLQTQSSSSSSVDGTAAAESDLGEMGEILRGLGVVAPVLRVHSVGQEDYLRKLSAQIAELLLKDDRLQKVGGTMTLTDAYYLYNRARGTALVSPQDFRDASERIEHSTLNKLKLTRYASGLMVIQMKQVDDDAMCMEIVHLTESRGYVSSADIAQKMKLPILLAKELLQLAESKEYICRDGSPSGLLFYPNYFLTL